jgi:hypothetical protein
MESDDEVREPDGEELRLVVLTIEVLAHLRGAYFNTGVSRVPFPDS